MELFLCVATVARSPNVVCSNICWSFSAYSDEGIDRLVEARSGRWDDEGVLAAARLQWAAVEALKSRLHAIDLACDASTNTPGNGYVTSCRRC